MKRLATLAAVMIAFSAQAAELYLYAGAGLKDPVERIVQQFEKDTGNKVTVEYGGSG
ncbi:substrate-binding domain-containing protein, partial [Aggregatibacter actinomycetemcomitans]